MKELIPAEMFDHQKLIMRQAPAMAEWTAELGRIANHYPDDIQALIAQLLEVCALYGIMLRRENRDSQHVLLLEDHGLRKEVMTIGYPLKSEGMAKFARGFYRSASELAPADKEDLDIPLLMRNGYNEYAFAMEMQSREDLRVIAYEYLALRLLARVHPDDLKNACMNEEYVPQIQSEVMIGLETVRNDDLLANTLERRDIELAGIGPDGVTISKRLGMVHITPCDIGPLTIIGNNMIIRQMIPATALAGAKISDIIDAPIPFDDLRVEQFTAGQETEVVTSGYNEAIERARFFVFDQSAGAA